MAFRSWSSERARWISSAERGRSAVRGDWRFSEVAEHTCRWVSSEAGQVLTPDLLEASALVCTRHCRREFQKQTALGGVERSGRRHDLGCERGEALSGSWPVLSG